MASARQHLVDMHKSLKKDFEDAKAHHLTKETHHRAEATRNSKFARFHKADSVDTAGIYQDAADDHAKLPDHHAGEADRCQARAEFHGLQMQECMKAADGDLNKMVPDRVSGVTPPAFGSRAIPRAGAPNMAEKANVPLEFERLVAIEYD
jgi:hypothetical protein